MYLLLSILSAISFLHLYPASQSGRSPDRIYESDKPGMRDSDGQRFTCNTGYTLAACLRDIATLQGAVRKYPLRALGQWNWILVKTADWKPFVVHLGFSPNSPALTCLELKMTFVEEAIVIDKGDRTRELVSEYKMSRDRLLNYAVTHEMGHGICSDVDESHANEVAAKLQAGKPFACRTVREHSGESNSAPLPPAIRSGKYANCRILETCFTCYRSSRREFVT
jgi:hypothetical protein